VKHRANRKFWQHYEKLPAEIQRLADRNFELLKQDAQGTPRSTLKRSVDFGRFESVFSTEP
jgi:hypothetical protein